MARTRKALPARIDVAHLISAGVLASVCPRPLIEEVLAQAGKASRRERLLPAPAVVYYVMALALWREAPTEEVLRVVCEGLHWLGAGADGAESGHGVRASKAAISQARTRLGPEVMQTLASRVLKPIAQTDAPGAFYRGLRLVAFDGSSMDVADEAANAAYFGYLGTGNGHSGYPQARVLALIECGTHAVLAADIVPYRHSEHAMAASMLPTELKADMLVLADRNFYGFKLWTAANQTGAKLLWRIKSDLKLPVASRLPDGSYLSTVYDSKDRKREHGQQVRVIEYTLNGSAPSTPEHYRLLTNVLDHELAPADELAALYPERWESWGGRRRLRRAQNPPARQQHGAAQQNPRACPARVLGLSARAFRDPPTHGAGRLASKARPRPIKLHSCGARDQTKTASSGSHSPLSACHSGAMPCSKRSRAVASSAAADGAIRAA